MSEARRRLAVDLGEVEPARSRHAGRRSAVELTDSLVVVGTSDGTLRAFDRPTLDERWCVPGETDGSVVSIVESDGGLVVGERGPAGEIRSHDRETGLVRWRYETASELGSPQKDTRFFLPFVVALASDGDRTYAAARRYERLAGERSFTSDIYAFEGDGSVAWSVETDASPIALDRRDDRLAVGFNRCPGDHRDGLVVFDAATGEERMRWDPDAPGERRVGDVSLVDDGALVASHADYRGYRLDRDGTERWRVDLGRPTDVGDETLYTYPNHVHASEDGAVFVTGNTYATEGRETEGLHPDEHSATGWTPAGESRWSADVGGFASELAADGSHVAVPGAQHFRTRDADAHGLRVLHGADGPVKDHRSDGVVTAVAIDDGWVAAVEEPVVYHDEGTERGDYRLLAASLD
jgi:outer membrane protein assembly factor BamB